MELRHLRYLTAVARAGSFARAASSLRVAQPALSKQIRDLEREIGAELFAREPRGARLTAEGESVRRSADAVMHAAAELSATARLAQRGMIGRCRLSVGPVPLLGDRIGVALAALRKHLPDIDLEVRETPSVEHARMLRAGETDIAIGARPASNEPRIDISAFYRDPVDSAAIPSAHALAKRASVTCEQLRAMPALVLSRKTLPHVMTNVIAALRRHGFSDIEEIDTLATITANVVAGRGWTLATRSQRGGRASDGYAVVPIDDLRIPFTVTLSLRAREKSPMVRNVAQALHGMRAARWRVSKATRHGARDEKARGKNAPAHLGLELRHLRAFVTLMEERNLTRAAERLGLSQPGLSRRISDLERMLEAQLFERGERGVVPTHVADLLERHARDTLSAADAITENVHDARRGIRATIDMGIVAPAMRTVVAPVMTALARECPHLAITHHALDTTEQPRALEREQIDVGIAHSLRGLLDDAVIDGVQLWEDRLDMAMLASDHPLARKPSLQATDLADEPALFPHPHWDRAFHDDLMVAFEALGLEPKIAGTYFSLRTMWSLAANGVGWMVGAHSQRKAPPPGLVAVRVEGLSIPWGFDLLWRRGEESADVLGAIRVMRTAQLPRWSEF